MDREFISRLDQAFDGATMATVARRLGIPHATVRNYYKEGRLPAPEVLIKIASVTGISLNWLLMGRGRMYESEAPTVDIGRVLEVKITEIVERKLSAASGIQQLGTVDSAVFDVSAAIERLDDPEAVMSEWFRHEGREYPQDYGIAFFRGWGSFSSAEKEAAVRDAKRVIDRSLGKGH